MNKRKWTDRSFFPCVNFSCISLTEHGMSHKFSCISIVKSCTLFFLKPILIDLQASNSLHENSIASTSSNSLWNNYWTDQHLTNDATKIVPKQTKFVQSMRCEVCKIDCNSKEVYEKHMRGKKHLRNLQAQVPRSSIDGQVMFGALGGAAGEDLGTKKRKLLNGDAAADSVRVCTICNVTCNSQEVFNKHLAGKRHASQVN